MRPQRLSIFVLILSVAAVFPFAGRAAPQILGLVATATPLPMHCVDGVCSVEVSGVCLQEHRPAPLTGTAYRAAKGADLTLVVRDRDGVTRTLAVAELVDIRSLRLFNAVSVSLPHHVVQQLGGDGVQASLSVGPLTTVLPVATAGDATPLSEAEIRDYTGPLRAVAETAIGRDDANLTATRILNHMVNRLSAETSYGAEAIAAVRDQTMERIGNKTAAEMPAVVRLVTRALDTCREKLRVERTPHLRACLSNQHDNLNSNTTQTVWRSLRPGS